MSLTGTKALEAWARKITTGYENVNILNMSTSWRNGLGFCAIIHYFHPQLIDFQSLDPDDVFGNNSLAFTVAEQQLGIPALLDPNDMVKCELLDRLSILTYLSQYYQILNSNTPVKNPVSSSVTSSPMHTENARTGAGENCALCGSPVYILERLSVAGKLFHRTCFKCARCEEQLTLVSFYETETGQFCCEVCPDEEDHERRRTLRTLKQMTTEVENTYEEDEDQESLEVQSANSSISLGASSSKPDTEHFFEGEINAKEMIEANSSTVEIVVSEPNIPNENHEYRDNILVDNHTINTILENNEDGKKEVEEELNSIDMNENVLSAQCEKKVELVKKNSYPENCNPFGDDEDEEEEETQTQMKINSLLKTENTQMKNDSFLTIEDSKEESTNPFGSDCDTDDDGKTQTLETVATSLQISGSCNVSQNPFGDDLFSDEDILIRPPPSPSFSVASSSVVKKKRPAPKPPGLTSIPGTPRVPITPVPAARISIKKVQDVKSRKDADNINRKNELLSKSDISTREGQLESHSQMPADKADEGQWRRKKGPAPPRPLPPKRSVKKLPRKAINQELLDIEVKQVGLERQGVKLEKSIREICSVDDAREGARDSLGPEAEDLIIQLFDLVNEKNELFRRQTELVYMKKENRLEEIHADLEYQIRVLMAKPECQRTDDDKVGEERLIAKLVEVVSQRNFIVDCLELDRRRELDEDTAIEDHMSNYAAVQPSEKPQIALVKLLKRKKKKNKGDDEKDVDTSETKGQEEKQAQKEKSAKKKILSMTTKKLNSLNLSLKKK